MSDSATVWNELFTKLEEGGEFIIKSSFSDSSASGSGSGSGSEPGTGKDSQMSTQPPMASMQKSQGRAREVFGDISNRPGMDLSQMKDEIDEMAKEAVQCYQASMPATTTRMLGTVNGTATQYVSPAVESMLS